MSNGKKECVFKQAPYYEVTTGRENVMDKHIIVPCTRQERDVKWDA